MLIYCNIVIGSPSGFLKIKICQDLSDLKFQNFKVSFNCPFLKKSANASVNNIARDGQKCHLPISSADFQNILLYRISILFGESFGLKYLAKF